MNVNQPDSCVLENSEDHELGWLNGRNAELADQRPVLNVVLRHRHIVYASYDISSFTYLNRVKVVDFNDPAPKFTDGNIGLRIHTGGGVKVRWKDPYVKEE